jgi:hypothetical protein
MHNKMAAVAICITALAMSTAAQTAVTNNNDGATGAVPVYTGSSTLGNSPIAVSGGNVGIGTTNPDANLQVNGEYSYSLASGLGASTKVKDYTYNLWVPSNNFIFKTNQMWNGGTSWAVLTFFDGATLASKEVYVNIVNQGGTNIISVTPGSGSNNDVAMSLEWANETSASGITEFYITLNKSLAYAQSVKVEGFNI